MAWSWQDTSPNNQVSENIQIQIWKYIIGLLFGLETFKYKYVKHQSINQSNTNMQIYYWFIGWFENIQIQICKYTIALKMFKYTYGNILFIYWWLIDVLTHVVYLNKRYTGALLWYK